MPTLDSIKNDLIEIISTYHFPLVFLHENNAYLLNRPTDVITNRSPSPLTLRDLSISQLVQIAESPISSFSQPLPPWEMGFEDIWNHYFPNFTKPHSHTCHECGTQIICTNARCQDFPVYAACEQHEGNFHDHHSLRQP
jgi:hypothetical protein